MKAVSVAYVRQLGNLLRQETLFTMAAAQSTEMVCHAV